VRKSEFAAFKLLLEQGADLSLKDSKGRVIKDYIVLAPEIWDEY
jgi:hypothetical protein